MTRKYLSIYKECSISYIINNYKMIEKIDFVKLVDIMNRDIEYINNIKNKIYKSHCNKIYLNYTYSDYIKNIIHYIIYLFDLYKYNKLTEDEKNNFKTIFLNILTMFNNEKDFCIYKEYNICINNGNHPCIYSKEIIYNMIFYLYEEDRHFYGKKLNNMYYILYDDNINFYFNKHYEYIKNILSEELMMYVWHPYRIDKWKYLTDEIDFYM